MFRTARAVLVPVEAGLQKGQVSASSLGQETANVFLAFSYRKVEVGDAKTNGTH